MYYRGKDWGSYIAHDVSQIKVSISSQTFWLQRTQEQTSKATQDNLSDIKSAQYHTASHIQAGFGRLIANQQTMTTIIQEALLASQYQLNRVHGSIEQMRAYFDWAMGSVIWILETHTQSLQDILQTLQAPLDTQAKELRKRAETAYINGWYDEALNDFLESEGKNYQDFAVHHAIGTIYLYHKQPTDFDNALAYYLKAAKYAEPRSKYHAALAYMYAGFVCYLQESDDEAIELASRATELHPDLTEAWYNLAKFAAVNRKPDVAIPALERAILTDTTYAVKASTDADFTAIETDVVGLLERLRAEAKQIVDTEWQPLLAEIQRAAIPDKDRTHIDQVVAQIETMIADDTCFGYWSAYPKIEECRKVKVTTDTILRLRKKTTEHVVPSDPNLLNRELNTIEQALQAAQTPEQEAAAQAQVHRFEEMLSSGLFLAMEKKFPSIVPAVAFGQDGLIATAVADTGVLVWKAKNGQDYATLFDYRHVFPVAFSPDGRLLAYAVTRGDYPEQTICLWDVKSKQECFRMKGHSSTIRSVAFSPDGKLLASGSSDKTVMLWSVSSGTLEAVLRGHTDWVNTVAFSPDGKLLASGSDDTTVRLWDVSRKTAIVVLRNHERDINSVSFSPDGKLLSSASSDRTVRLWDVLSHGQKFVLEHKSNVNSVAFSPDGRILASGDVNVSDSLITLCLWNVSTGRKQGEQPVATFESGIGGPIFSLSFSPDGHLLAVASINNNTVWVWKRGLPKGQWEQQQREARERKERERKEREEREQKRREQEARERKERERKEREEREERERKESEERQRQEWIAAGCCEVCGQKLGFFEKIGGNTKCKKHWG